MTNQEKLTNSEDVKSSETRKQSTEKPKEQKQKNSWMIAISALLFLLLVINTLQFFITYRQNQIYSIRASSYEERVEEANKLLEKQQEIIFDLMDDYTEDVYNNPMIKNINHQLLMAAEYQVIGLQIIAIQNTQIIELLASMP